MIIKKKQIKITGYLIFGILIVAVAIWIFLDSYANRLRDEETFGVEIWTSVISLLFGLSFIIIPYTKFGKRWKEKAEKDRETMIMKQTEEVEKLAEEQPMITDETSIIVSLWNTFVGILNFVLCLIAIFAIIALIWFILKGLYGLLLFGVRQI